MLLSIICAISRHYDCEVDIVSRLFNCTLATRDCCCLRGYKVTVDSVVLLLVIDLLARELTDPANHGIVRAALLLAPLLISYPDCVAGCKNLSCNDTSKTLLLYCCNNTRTPSRATRCRRRRL
jgi:hypothetical protein